mmetsp:Transcript_14258/g.51281  ORF Transcript_14258/g.51281 Transcript_14258/m.51281 type:complete len:253 (-) Transcript_14258:149-907(-)
MNASNAIDAMDFKRPLGISKSFSVGHASFEAAVSTSIGVFRIQSLTPNPIPAFTSMGAKDSFFLFSGHGIPYSPDLYSPSSASQVAPFSYPHARSFWRSSVESSQSAKNFQPSRAVGMASCLSRALTASSDKGSSLMSERMIERTRSQSTTSVNAEPSEAFSGASGPKRSSISAPYFCCMRQSTFFSRVNTASNSFFPRFITLSFIFDSSAKRFFIPAAVFIMDVLNTFTNENGRDGSPTPRVATSPPANAN